MLIWTNEATPGNVEFTCLCHSLCCSHINIMLLVISLLVTGNAETTWKIEWLCCAGGVLALFGGVELSASG